MFQICQCLYSDAERRLHFLSESNSIIGADGCKQASVDAVYSLPPDNAARGCDVTCHSKERMYVPDGLPAFASDCQPWFGLTRRGKAN